MKKRTALIILSALFITVFLGTWYYHTRTTLKADQVGRFRVVEAYEELCKGKSQLYPPTSTEALPAYSPDGRYYVEVHRLWPWERSRRAIKMYEAESGDQVGRYVSSERSIFLFCWAQDSTGVFAADYVPPSGSIFIGLGSPGRMGPVLKLLVP